MKLEKYKIKTQIVKCGENNKQVNVTVRYALVNDGNCLNKKDQKYRQFEIISCSNHHVCGNTECSVLPKTLQLKDF